MAYASINIVFKDQLLELKQQKLFEARLDYENRLSGLRASVERINDRLLLDQKSYLKKVDEVKAEFDDLAQQQKKMEDFFGRLFAEKRGIGSANSQQGRPPTLLLSAICDFKSRSEVVNPLPRWMKIS
jgi:hypothetical protein